jgi:hypothetical protein
LHLARVPLCALRRAGGTASRCSGLFFGTGIGAGIGYTECRNEFEAIDKPAAQ